MADKKLTIKELLEKESSVTDKNVVKLDDKHLDTILPDYDLTRKNLDDAGRLIKDYGRAYCEVVGGKVVRHMVANKEIGTLSHALKLGGLGEFAVSQTRSDKKDATGKDHSNGFVATFKVAAAEDIAEAQSGLSSLWED